MAESACRSPSEAVGKEEESRLESRSHSFISRHRELTGEITLTQKMFMGTKGEKRELAEQSERTRMGCREAETNERGRGVMSKTRLEKGVEERRLGIE